MQRHKTDNACGRHAVSVCSHCIDAGWVSLWGIRPVTSHHRLVLRQQQQQQVAAGMNLRQHQNEALQAVVVAAGPQGQQTLVLLLLLALLARLSRPAIPPCVRRAPARRPQHTTAPCLLVRLAQTRLWPLPSRNSWTRRLLLVMLMSAVVVVAKEARAGGRGRHLSARATRSGASCWGDWR